MKTIFLDFDGVLHVIQANFEERFSKLYLLEDLAKDFSFKLLSPPHGGCFMMFHL